MERITFSGTLFIPGIGNVNISARRNAKLMRLRWKGPELTLTVPYGIDTRQAVEFIRNSSEFIKSSRPAPLYRIGQVIEAPGLSIEIKEDASLSQIIRGVHNMHAGKAMLLVAPDVDIESSSSIESIDKILRSLATIYAKNIILPLAASISHSLGVRPAMWKIYSGQRTLGLCTSKGVIKLSNLLVLYPEDMRRYVVCHELAHLTHMDHTPAFHALCDRYYGASTKAVRKELKAYKLPLIR